MICPNCKRNIEITKGKSLYPDTYHCYCGKHYFYDEEEVTIKSNKIGRVFNVGIN